MDTGTGDPRRIWKRVAPTLEPWPGADVVGKALRDGAKADGVLLASDAAKKDKSVTGAQGLSVARTARSLDAATAAQNPRPVTPAQSPGLATTAHSSGLAAIAQSPGLTTAAQNPRPVTPAQSPGLATTAQSPRPVTTAQNSGLATAAQSPGPVITPGETSGLTDAGNLPGAEPDPCCMGTEAETDIAVLAGFAEDEYAERRQLQALARQAPVWARQTLLTLAARAVARAKKSLAAYYLITGETYLPALSTERIYVGKWLPALRERYHSAACTAMNYERAADGTPDPCLNALFRDLSADAFDCAAAVMRLLERALT